MRSPLVLCCLFATTVACPRTRVVQAPPTTIPVDRAGATLRSVGGDAATTYAASALPDRDGRPRSIVEARHAERPGIAWSAELAGAVGPIVRTKSQLAVALGGHEQVAGVAMRGDPALAIVGIDDSGRAKPLRAFESSDWVIATSLAAVGDDIVVGGSFVGSLRAGASVVASGGRSDGFVARLSPTGDVRWLVRHGGPHADAVQGVAVSGDRIAIAGTFAPGADLQGELLVAVDDKTPYADGFVAELDANGRVKWTATFGSKLDDSVAGVAFDRAGRVVVAAAARELTRIGTVEMTAVGPSDALVATWTPAGTLFSHVLLGGRDFDGARAIASVDGKILVGGFFSGTMQAGTQELVAGGGDDAFLLALDADRVTHVWPITGDGREELVGIAAVPGGFVAGIAHTARAAFDSAELPAPKDPMHGAAVVVRPF